MMEERPLRSPRRPGRVSTELQRQLLGVVAYTRTELGDRTRAARPKPRQKVPNWEEKEGKDARDLCRERRFCRRCA